MGNNLLLYVLPSAKLTATGPRWVHDLANFHINTHYKSGRNNADEAFFHKTLNNSNTNIRQMAYLPTLSSKNRTFWSKKILPPSKQKDLTT